MSSIITRGAILFPLGIDTAPKLVQMPDGPSLPFLQESVSGEDYRAHIDVIRLGGSHGLEFDLWVDDEGAYQSSVNRVASVFVTDCRGMTWPVYGPAVLCCSDGEGNTIPIPPEWAVQALASATLMHSSLVESGNV